jgi:hypothetical protein
VGVERVEHLYDIGGGDFTAQMQEMVGTQQLTLGQARERLRATRLQVAVVHVDVRTRADSERIENRRDSGCGHLGIVDHECGVDIPAHAWAGREMLLEVVGVQFDQTGQQIVAVPVLGIRRGRFREILRLA